MNIKLFSKKKLCLCLFLFLVGACRTVGSDSTSYQFGVKGESGVKAQRDYVIVETNDKKNIKLPLFVANQMDTLSNLVEDFSDVLDDSPENTQPVSLIKMNAKELKLITDLLAINTEADPKKLTTADVAAAVGDLKNPKHKDRCLKLLLDSNFLAAEDLLEKTAFYLASSLTVTEIYLLGRDLPPCKGKTCVANFRALFKAKPKGYVLPQELVDMILRMKTGVKAVDASASATCVIRNDDMVQCWGSDAYGQNNPYNAAQGWTQDQQVKTIALGHAHGCATTLTNKLKCWGWDHFHQCQITAPLTTTDIQYMSVGDRHYQVITSNGEVKVCGNEEYGKLTIPGDLGPIKEIGGGFGHTCALTIDDQVRCWGQYTDESKRGRRGGRNLPPRDLGQIKKLIVGSYHNCIIDDQDELNCWGELPENKVDRQGLPPSKLIRKPDALGKVREVALGTSHTCVRQWNHRPVCWGINTYNQASIPPEFAETKIKSIAAGAFHSCMILFDDTVHCFGDNDKNQTVIPDNLQRHLE